jgi:carboxyvinyl-carboxyphosphonate phosphorylmutase
MKKTKLLRTMMDEPGIIVMPCCYDCLSAKLIERVGYKVVGVTGAGICASQLGVPDFGLLTMTEVLNQTRNIVNSTNLPVICDCDNGYGGPINISRTVREFERGGVAGFWFEDQVIPKRCGHFEGKEVISKEDMIMKIKAAVDARTDSDLVIVARTDAREVLGLDDAISRANDYLEAGADMIFLEAPRSVDELKKIAASVNAPQMVNLVEGGKTPLLRVKELEQMGFKIASFSGSTQKVAIKAIERFLVDFHRTGDINLYLEDMVSLNERSALLELDQFYRLEKKYGSPSGE